MYADDIQQRVKGTSTVVAIATTGTLKQLLSIVRTSYCIPGSTHMVE